MPATHYLRAWLLGTSCAAAVATSAFATNFDVPGGSLEAALSAYSTQSGVQVMIPNDVIGGVRSRGVKGELPPSDALSRILSGTGFVARRDSTGVIGIVPETHSQIDIAPIQLAQASPPRAAVETVTVTSSKLGGADVQSIPIAITALSQEQLTATQTAGGPDLVKQVPNLTFTKTNFTGYSIQVRGIGTQAISVATDPAVAVAFNDTPFIRNHFFEQEFYDLSQVEVLRGPQGTLYGRNSTAGVVNITSAKPTDQFEAMASVDVGNYKNRRLEGMLNLPIAGDKLDLRVAGEWTKRDGYTFNETTGQQIDGRDLWSGRVTLGWKPVSSVQSYLIWEHFQEDDDRLRSGKQLCKTDPGAGSFTAVDGTAVQVPSGVGRPFSLNGSYFSQGCLPSSLYSADAFGVPNGFSLPFVSGAAFLGLIRTDVNPYAETNQSTNLRDIQSALEPKYRAKNDTLEWNTAWNVSPTLTLYSDTGYNRDYLWSSEDYNRFDTTPGVFLFDTGFGGNPYVDSSGVFCDPQLGCSDRLVVQDLATEHSWQLNQEFRLASNSRGPFNFSLGVNYLHYETEENYYVFSNTFTMISLDNICPGLGGVGVGVSTITDSIHCLVNGRGAQDPRTGGGIPTEEPQYIDPNPITSLDDAGHNYFVSQNPYTLNSYAGFGEVYYDVTQELRLTGGLRWTDDQKHFTDIPSQLVTRGFGYPSTGVVNQIWQEWTGRFVANWSPKLSFTDQSMFYASFAHGYKAGGANPPGPVLINADTSAFENIEFPVHPLDFKPEFINAYELGTKNTAFDGALTLNGDVFFYDYKGYQISQIVDRTAINLNFDATVRGAELEATWEPFAGLKFSFAGGYEATRINNGQSAIDLIDRTAARPGWIVMKPSIGQSSNCVFPEYVAAALVQRYGNVDAEGNPGVAACGFAYAAHVDPVTQLPYNPATTSFLEVDGVTSHPYPGYDPLTVDPNAPANVNNGLGLPSNNGEGFQKDVSGNELPNAPHFTLSLGADYTTPVSSSWAVTLHSDFYWQAQSWARVFNDDPYDRIHGYTNVNLAVILTDASGWQVMGYVKNVFDTTAITGDFLNSDDSGLTTNIFLTDPRLFGVRVTKHFEAGSGSGGGLDFLNSDGGRPQVWVQVGGNFNATLADGQQLYAPSFEDLIPDGLPSPRSLQKMPKSGFDWEGSVTIQPEDSDWKLVAGVRYGRSAHRKVTHISLPANTRDAIGNGFFTVPCASFPPSLPTAAICTKAIFRSFEEGRVDEVEQHTMIDFTLGKDVGLGVFGNGGMQTIGGGVRIAQFTSRSNNLFNTDPHYAFETNITVKYHDVYNGVTQERRDFHGVGPELTWDASQPIFGETTDGEISVDWGVNVAVLFGRQKADVEHQRSHCHASDFNNQAKCLAVYTPTTITETYKRSRTIAVPNVGGHLGLSVRYANSKISFGYRADTFFNAMDGGQETAHDENRGFYGPYMNVSLGL